MTHPQHGATHANDNSEAERLKTLGWSDESAVGVTPDVLAYINAAPTDAVVPIRRGPGRPKKA